MNVDRNSSVLFVCMGNICRSPAAEGVLQNLVNDRGLSNQILIDSAGTISYHAGNRADARMRKAASKRGYELSNRARQIVHNDLAEFDLVVAMDRSNRSEITGLHSSPSAELKLFSDFLDDRWPIDVPDPYYGGRDGFETVLDMIESGCPRIIDYLTSNDDFSAEP